MRSFATNSAIPELGTSSAAKLGCPCAGTAQSNSRRGPGSLNPSENSPAALYARVFGPDFKDPNAADFTPDPEVMARKSALSIVTEQRQALMKELGASKLSMTDDPASTFLSYGIGRAEIYAPAPRFSSPSAPRKSDDPKPPAP